MENSQKTHSNFRIRNWVKNSLTENLNINSMEGNLNENEKKEIWFK